MTVPSEGKGETPIPADADRVGDVPTGPAVVFGGSGLLGEALSLQLLRSGREVRVFDLHPPQTPELGDCYVAGDLCDSERVHEVLTGAVSAFQTAAMIDWSPRPPPELLRINIDGNRTIIAACVEMGVQRLVYTSSMDVVFDGTPIVNGDETLPYPRRHLDGYGESKMIAEKDTLAANGRGALRTAAIRSTGIFGPRARKRFDPFFAMIRRGAFYAMGDGSARISQTFVENCAHLHLVVESHLGPAGKAAGQAYFAADGTINFFAEMDRYLTALGRTFRRRRLPYRLMWLLGWLGDLLWRLPGPHRKRPPSLSRYTIAATCRDMWFSDARARIELGYQPLVTPEEAFERTLAWLRTAYGDPDQGSRRSGPRVVG